MAQNPLSLPSNFIQTVRSCFGERGDLWLRSLPAFLEEVSSRWSLTLLPPYPNLTYNYVAPVLLEDGTEVVLKAGIPHEELLTEIAALQVYEGCGVARLLQSDAEQGVFLLERLRPGTVLTTLADEVHDEEATSIAASVMRSLWKSAPSNSTFPTVTEWAQGMQRLRSHFGGGVGPFPVRLVEEAEGLFTDLLASMAPPVLLHGDLHHDNILSAERAPWLAIDPKGLIGEPAYEVGALLRNLWPERHRLSNPARILERRLSILSEELDLDRERLRGWAMAQAVLSAWWSVEDNEDGWQPTITIAEMLSEIKV
jgi:streptomycin 6-kinase